MRSLTLPRAQATGVMVILKRQNGSGAGGVPLGSACVDNPGVPRRRMVRRVPVRRRTAMSDRFDDFGVERASESTPPAPQGSESDRLTSDDRPEALAPQDPLSWAVPLGGHPEPVVSSDALA